MRSLLAWKRFTCFGLSFILMLAVSLVLTAKGHEPGDSSQTNKEDQQWCEYVGTKGPGLGKRIVLIAGDDEYRSEEAMPMLGQVLAKHHGFHCTVLFPINPETKLIQPDFQTNIPGMHFLDEADLVILGLRFRNLPDEDMQHFVNYVKSGKPIIGTRTSTHAFRIPRDRKFHQYSFNNKEWRGGFGQQILGDTWVNHHGRHGSQSTRGIIEAKNKTHPILKGVEDVWGPTDVYGITHLPENANILMRGQVIEGMKPGDPPLEGKKNDPMMPLAWTLEHATASGKTSRIFTTTMGSSTDFESEDLRRMIVNASFWCLGMEDQIADSSKVDIVNKYQPTNFGFGSYQKGMKPADFNWRE